MINSTTHKFPDCFPDNFEADILPNDAEFAQYKAFRILKHGVLDRTAFISSFEEFKDSERKPARPLDPRSASTYSTSLFSDFRDAEGLLKCMCRHYPRPSIAEGITEHSCGPCKKSYNSSHIDWWIFKDASPEKFFKVVEQNEP